MNKYNQNDKSNKKENKSFVDYNIRRGNIRLINEFGKIEIIDRDEAIDRAKDKGMNLVEIGFHKSEFPHSLCKIMDYGKYKFEQKKREKENARKSKIANAEAKEVVFTIRIDDGDFNHKVKQIYDFLVDENLKVKITIKLSKREIAVKDIAIDLMKRILKNFENLAVLDNRPFNSDRIISCTIRPTNSQKLGKAVVR